MKRTLLQTILLGAMMLLTTNLQANSTDLSTMDNVIYVKPQSAEVGTEATLSFMMKNTAGIHDFQFDLYLPEGVTAVKDSKGRFIASFNSGRLPVDDEHLLTLSEEGDGAIRFQCSSLYEEVFTGNEGEILTMKVSIAETMTNGDYPIVLKNMRLCETDISKYYDIDYVETALTVTGGEELGIATFNLGASPGVSTPEGFFTFDTSGKWNFNSKYTDAEYGGIQFTSGLKIENTTRIFFTTPEVTTVTIVQSTLTDSTIKFDGEELALEDAAAGTGCRIYTIEDVPAGDHTIGRGSGESGLFYIKVSNKSEGAEWKQVYRIDYSDYTSFPFYPMSFTPQWVDGVMVDQGADGWHQYFLADNIPTEVGGSYTVKAMVKASEEVTFNVNLGWGWNEGEKVPKDVTVGTEWQEVTWDYDNVGGTSCNLVAQPSKGGVTIEWKYLEVGYEETAYTVAGTEALTGYSWDETKNRMKYSSDTGLYTWVANGITVKSDSDLAFKIVKDGNWATSWPESNWVINTDVTGGKGIFTITISFNAETKDISVTPVKTEDIVDTWTDIIVNGDMEGDNNECFYVTEQGIGGPFLANLTEGIGVDGSRGVRVESYDEPSADWDTQFFIRLPYQIPAGTEYRVSFDYKADKPGDFDTQSHTEPGGYIHWASIGSGSCTTEWQIFEAEGTVSTDMSKEDKPFQTICFNLAKNKVRTNFIFDNVKFEVPTEVLATLTKNPAVDPKPYTRPAYNSMVIVGDFLIGDDKWEPANGWEMEQDAENPAVWTLTKEFTAEAKTYEYKATANGRWGDYELPDKGNAEFNFDDPNLGAGAYSLTFTVDTRLHALDLSVKKLGLTTYTATFTTNADYWTDVYAYAWSGEEPNVKKFLGDWPGTKLTPDGAGVYTVSIEAMDAPEKIIFNNGNSGEGNQTADLDFVNGAAYEFKAASGEEDPIKEAPAGWTNAVTNGNLAGDDVSSFVAKEYPSVVIDPAVIYAGAGTKGSRGILVKTADETEVSGASDWDSQFFIVLPEALPEGSKLHVEFDYKASEAATAGTQAYGNPGAYQHWAAIGDVNFTTEWQTFSTEFEVDASMAKGNNGTGSGTGLKSICFNLAVNKNAVEYHFDNFGVWYQKPIIEKDPEVYTEFVAETGTLTYYYDGKIEYRKGVTEVYDPNATRFAGYKNDVQMAVIDPSMKEAPLTSTKEMFYELFNMESIDGLENLNTADVTDMKEMFYSCKRLTTLDLSTFDTHKVKDMEGMFENCTWLEILDITSFDVSNVTNFMLMFSQCTRLRTICCFGDWSGFSAQSGYMFYGCRALCGGEGTAYTDAVTDKTYARPDGGTSAPGYFTADTMTGISLTPALSEGEGAIYNLAGQRLSKHTKGINIVGDKKIIVK